MRMTRLAYMNFKSSFKSYLSLVISLAFTILVFFNFQNMLYSDTFIALGERNQDNINMLIQTISFVMGCFMFFFIWYATNVFLTKRKKEIGIYVFMGLSNQKIGKLYMLETAMIGLVALVTGIVFGIITSGLFQMIMLAISDIAIEIQFRFSIKPVMITVGVFLVIYLLFVLKGYCNILRSSVLNMISAARQNEYVKQNKAILSLKAVLGVCVLGVGYYLAIKDGGQEVMGNVLIATVLVTCGVYLLFGGIIPLLFQTLAGSKGFLYSGQRCLWVNQVIFRMKKNYRTYAMVCILVLCSVTALATGFAMKYRYDNMVLFDNTYTFQLMSNQTDLEKKATQLIEGMTEIAYQSEIPVSCSENGDMIVSYSDVKQLAGETGLEFELKEPAEDEIICLSHLTLLSLINQQEEEKIEIRGSQYRQTDIIRIPYLGYLQRQGDLYLVNDQEYERLKTLGEELIVYNYKISDNDAFKETKAALDAIVSNTEENYTGRVAIDPNSGDMEWIKVLHTLCIFLFMVFIVAGGCIMFMKLYNDAFEEKERYLVMRKLGFEEKVLKKSIARELATAYILPFIIMTISAYFSVHALEKMMYANLFSIYLVSVLIVLAVFVICYCFSVAVYQRNVGIK